MVSVTVSCLERESNLKFPRIVLCLIVLAASAFAADVDGKWTGTFTTPNGDTPVNFTFKADGTKLTGTTTGQDGTEIKISDGKVDGANISFAVSIDFGGMPFTMTYKGVVAKDQIKLTLDIFGMPLEIVVKKAT
jgi:hypothetical protein